MRRHTLAALLMVCLLPVAAHAQIQLSTATVKDTINADGDSVELHGRGLGFGSVKVQTLDSYSGTWEVQCAPDGTNYDTGTELKLTPSDSSSVAVAVTDSVGIWDVQNAGGCQAIRVIATAGFAATDTVVVITATQSGGGSGAGIDEPVSIEGQDLTDILSVLNQIDADTDTLSALAPDCDATAPITISTIANNEIIPLAAGEVIKVCGILLVARGTVEVQPIYGTGTACATGEANLSGPVSLKVDGTQPPGFSHSNAGGTFFVPAGNAFCVELSAGVQVDGFVSYVQYTP